MLKLSLKQGEYLNIGDNIRVVYAGGAGNHIRLLVDAPRDVNIARNKTETNPERRKGDRKSTRLNSSHQPQSRMPSSA